MFVSFAGSHGKQAALVYFFIILFNGNLIYFMFNDVLMLKPLIYHLNFNAGKRESRCEKLPAQQIDVCRPSSRLKDV